MADFKTNISIIFPSFNGEMFLERNFKSIMNLENLSEIELVIIDNNSNDSTIKIINDFAQKLNIKLIEKKSNLGFAKACNLGVKKAEGEFIFITNQDMIFTKDFFKKLIRIYNSKKKEKDIIISPAIIFENGTIHYYGAKIHIFGFSYTKELGEILPKKGIVKKTQRFSGGSLFMKKSLFNSLGGFDKSTFMYYEDTDLSLKCLRMGIDIFTTSDPFIIHQKHDWSFSDFRYYLLERNRFIIFAKNINGFKKILPFFLLNELILIYHSIIKRKFGLRIRIYYEILTKLQLFKKIREQSKRNYDLYPYKRLSRELDDLLIRDVKIGNIFKKILKIFNKLLGHI